MDALTSVFFLMPDGPYRAGDIAGVPEIVAKKLIESSPKKARLARDSDHRPQKSAKDVMSSKGDISVTFIKSQPPYRIGESAGFNEDLAQAYIDGGVAVLTEGVVSKGMDGPVDDKAILDPKVKKALGR